jgi:Protein of unknown function (DUF2628)
MPVYTVYEPPRRSGDALAHTSRFKFVRDGFHWTAFLFTPFWLLRHRLWLELVFIVVIVIGLWAGLQRLGGGEGFGLLSTLLVQLFVGMEAASLRRWKLARRGYRNLGIVIGDDRESAERRFFDNWITDQTPAAPAAASMPPRVNPTAPTAPEVVGLFPQPDGRP